MAENKKSFLLYVDLIHTVQKLPDDYAGKLFKHLLAYVNDQDPETDDIVVNIAFEPIKQSLKRDLLRWDQTREKRSKAGKISAEKRNKNEQNETNKTTERTKQQNDQQTNAYEQIALNPLHQEQRRAWLQVQMLGNRCLRCNSLDFLFRPNHVGCKLTFIECIQGAGPRFQAIEGHAAKTLLGEPDLLKYRNLATQALHAINLNQPLA
jgi:hypothetical protein